jgi:hypothetical protein
MHYFRAGDFCPAEADQLPCKLDLPFVPFVGEGLWFRDTVGPLSAILLWQWYARGCEDFFVLYRYKRKANLVGNRVSPSPRS